MCYFVNKHKIHLIVLFCGSMLVGPITSTGVIGKVQKNSWRRKEEGVEKKYAAPPMGAIALTQDLWTKQQSVVAHHGIVLTSKLFWGYK